MKGQILKEEFGVISIKVIDSVTQEERIRLIQQFDILKIERSTVQSGQTTSPEKGNKIPNNPYGEQNLEISPESPNIANIKEIITKNHRIEATQEIPKPTITESPTINQVGFGNVEKEFDPFAPIIPRRRQAIPWNRQITGYRGFIDYGYTHGIGKNGNNRLEFASSSGYQFNPIFFLGAGVSYSLSINKKESSAPIFINPRLNFLDNGTTPFWDVKAGYSIIEGKGFYFSTAFGISVSKNDKYAFNAGIGYSFQNATFNKPSDLNPQLWIKTKEKYNGLFLRLTFEY